jgi:hypothetical protein
MDTRTCDNGVVTTPRTPLSMRHPLDYEEAVLA